MSDLCVYKYGKYARAHKRAGELERRDAFRFMCFSVHVDTFTFRLHRTFSCTYTVKPVLIGTRTERNMYIGF